MAAVTPQLIKELRERTQAGMADCKNALVEAEGSIEAAVEIILKKGLVKSAKRASATASEGEVRTFVSPDASYGVVLEVNIQTDFAARNENFKAFVTSVFEVAKKAKPSDDLVKLPMPGTSKTIEQVRDELIATIGEKISVRRFDRLEHGVACGCVHTYLHMNGKIGVLLAVEAEKPEVLKHAAFEKFVDDTAMQIAAMNALYLDRSEVPAEDLAKQTEIFEAQLRDDGKPEKAWPKIIEGKANKWYTEICLVDQESVIDNTKSIEQARAEAAKEAGGNIRLIKFVRYQLGEGIAKKVDDFAAEAQKMAGG